SRFIYEKTDENYKDVHKKTEYWKNIGLQFGQSERNNYLKDDKAINVAANNYLEKIKMMVNPTMKDYQNNLPEKPNHVNIEDSLSNASDDIDNFTSNQAQNNFSAQLITTNEQNSVNNN
ncbi:unnamed protein product, partial [Gordionus sp. m RMFG-2023]